MILKLLRILHHMEIIVPQIPKVNIILNRLITFREKRFGLIINTIVVVVVSAHQIHHLKPSTVDTCYKPQTS